MKTLRTLATLCAMTVMVLTAPSALAQKGGKRMEQGGGPSRHPQGQQVPTGATGPHHRDAHLEGRMTPEQRRQLRRDVHSHGRDIYHRQRPGAKQP